MVSYVKEQFFLTAAKIIASHHFQISAIVTCELSIALFEWSAYGSLKLAGCSLGIQCRL